MAHCRPCTGFIYCRGNGNSVLFLWRKNNRLIQAHSSSCVQVLVLMPGSLIAQPWFCYSVTFGCSWHIIMWRQYTGVIWQHKKFPIIQHVTLNVRHIKMLSRKIKFPRRSIISLAKGWEKFSHALVSTSTGEVFLPSYAPRFRTPMSNDGTNWSLSLAFASDCWFLWTEFTVLCVDDVTRDWMKA